MTTKPRLSEKFDPYFEWLDIAPAEQPADYYRLLGVKTFEQDVEVIRDCADERMSRVRQFQNGKHSKSSQRILNELSAAKSCLLNERLRRIYDTKLSRILDSQKLPDLIPPGKLFPDTSIPDDLDPFQGTAHPDNHDPLKPIESWSIWPAAIIALITLTLLAVTIASLQLIP